MKVCFIGLGSIGTRHCMNLNSICKERDIPLEIHAVRSSRRELNEALQKLRIKSLYSFEEMDPQYDMIFITNPTSMHYGTLMRAGDKSNYFFIEKPVFESASEDISLLPFSKEAVCYVAAPLRYTKVIREAEQFIRKHKIYNARAISSSYLPEWRPGQDYRTTYSAHKDLGGGVSIDLIHEWDYLSMLFGLPRRVYSLIGKYSDLEIDSDDLAIYIAEYPTHLVEVHLDYFGRETRRQLELFTNEGCWVFDIAHSCVAAPDGSRQEYSEKPNDKYINEMNSFLSLVQNHQKNSTNDINHASRILGITKGDNR